MKTKEIYLQSYCKSCKHCSGCYCSVFERPVDKQYNRCWLHSDYKPKAVKFQVRKDLEQIMQQEEQQRKADEIMINKELQVI